MSPGESTPARTVGAKLEDVNPAEIAAFCERELPRLVLFVTVSTSLDVHAAADVAQTAFERALPRWATAPAQGVAVPGGQDDGGQQTDFRWFRATPASLARLSLAVPAGLRAVAPPPLTAPRRALGERATR